MRQFVIVGHDAPTDPEFPLDDLPGSAGRLDVLCRCLTAGLLVSHGVREDVRVHLVLDDAVTITVDGGSVRRLNPDERSTAALVRTALGHVEEAIGHQPVESTPGFEVRRRGLADTLDALAREGSIVVLDPDGDPADGESLPPDPVFVLSDHHPFADAERDLLDDRADDAVSLGPVALHADQAIVVAHNRLDVAD